MAHADVVVVVVAAGVHQGVMMLRNVEHVAQVFPLLNVDSINLCHMGRMAEINFFTTSIPLFLPLMYVKESVARKFV